MGRFGGEELCVFLPDTPPWEAGPGAVPGETDGRNRVVAGRVAAGDRDWLAVGVSD